MIGFLGPKTTRRVNVLLVEPDEDVRDRIGEWLEDEGFDVLACPGPGAPQYTCVGSRAGSCPLEHDADVVVLNLFLASDAVIEGTPGEELLRYYLWKGHPVVALRHAAISAPATHPEPVRLVAWPPDREELVQAVRAATEGS